MFSVVSSLSWIELAAVPETYFTARGSLFEGLDLKPSDTLLIRGATCALGYAAIQIGKALGCKVIATTHRDKKLPLLKEADQAVLDPGELAGRLPGVTKALELVGPKTLGDTLNCMEKGGIVCNTGILGGIYGIRYFDPIKFIPNGVYLTGFHSNWPSQKVMDEIFTFLEEHKLTPCLGKAFPFSSVREACIAQDQGAVEGKIVVYMEEI